MSRERRPTDDALPLRKRSRSVPTLYGAVSLVLVAGALTFALSSPPPSTPPLAEVAPAPQENIEVERVEQSSQFGEGAGGESDCVPGAPGCEGASAEAPTSAPTPDASDPAADDRLSTGNTWNCVPGPGGARQTEDPQSPPCKLERFEGDNGGATWTGVTADAIRVAVPMHSGMRTAHDQIGQALVSHFNSRYEFYGRRLELVPVDEPEGDRDDPAVQRSMAAEVAAAEVFASLEYPRFGPFHEALAARGILSFYGGPYGGIVREAEVAALDPYVWATFLSFEDVQDIAGGLICGSLAGRPAQHGGSEVQAQTRRFGVLVQPDARPGVLLSRLAGCGADHRQYQLPEDGGDFEVIVRRMREDGVTTAVCVCRSFSRAGDYFDVADAIGYEPEWLVAGARVANLDTGNRITPNSESPRQMAHLFGLDVHLRRLSTGGGAGGGGRQYGEHYWYHAARDEDPSVSVNDASDVYYTLYAQLLMLASGVQWAGPELTPETFAEALRGLDHANPGVGQAPWFQPSVGFGARDHSFNSDVSLYWWRAADETARQARTDFGEMCYVGDGARFTATTVPADADDLLFDPEAGCR